jgi:peptide/nickel transport system ATP-binding protein
VSVLELRALRVSYQGPTGPVPAVRGVDLTVAAGEAIGVAGESGSGKSTLAAACLRLLPRTAAVTGTVILDGVDVLGASWGRLRAVRWTSGSIVFQGAMHALNPVRRVGEQITEPILLHSAASRRQARATAATLLERVGLPPARARAYPHELSGGQRQRVMIAMALACAPRLVIADEPTTALDVMVAAQVLRLLTDLVRQERAGLLMISHDLPMLATTCTRLAVMYAGQVVEQGPAPVVATRPRHPYAAALVAAHPVIGDPACRFAPRGLPGDPPDPTRLPVGCAFQARCARAVPSCADGVVDLRPSTGPHQAACVWAPDA